MDTMTRLICAKFIAEDCDADLFWQKASYLLSNVATMMNSVDLLNTNYQS